MSEQRSEGSGLTWVMRKLWEEAGKVIAGSVLTLVVGGVAWFWHDLVDFTKANTLAFISEAISTDPKTITSSSKNEHIASYVAAVQTFQDALDKFASSHDDARNTNVVGYVQAGTILLAQDVATGSSVNPLEKPPNQYPFQIYSSNKTRLNLQFRMEGLAGDRKLNLYVFSDLVCPSPVGLFENGLNQFPMTINNFEARDFDYTCPNQLRPDKKSIPSPDPEGFTGPVHGSQGYLGHMIQFRYEVVPQDRKDVVVPQDCKGVQCLSGNQSRGSVTISYVVIETPLLTTK